MRYIVSAVASVLIVTLAVTGLSAQHRGTDMERATAALASARAAQVSLDAGDNYDFIGHIADAVFTHLTVYSYRVRPRMETAWGHDVDGDGRVDYHTETENNDARNVIMRNRSNTSRAIWDAARGVRDLRRDRRFQSILENGDRDNAQWVVNRLIPFFELYIAQYDNSRYAPEPYDDPCTPGEACV